MRQIDNVSRHDFSRKLIMRTFASAIWLLPVLVMLAHPTLLFAQAEPLEVTWENIYTRNRGASQAALSPDGTQVAVVARTTDRAGIFLVPTDGSAEPKFWIRGSSPVWTADGKQIIFSRGGDFWMVELGSKDATAITKERRGGRAAQLSPDQKTLAYYSGQSGSQDIWLVPVDGSEEPKQLTNKSMAQDDRRFAPAWSPDGKQIAYFCNKNDYWEDDIWLVDVTSGEEQQISRGLMAMSTPVWSPDGTQIALMANSKSEFWYEDLSYIYLIDPVKKTEKILPMQVNATDMLLNHTVHWSADGSEIFFPYQARSETELWRVPSQGGVATRVTNMGGAFFSYHATPDASGFVFVRSTSTRGADIDYVSASGGTARRLTRFATEWKGLVDPPEISYRSYDGLYIQAFMFKPPGFDESKTWPTLVMVHGGGTNTYYKRSSLAEQYLAQQGYVVLAVNYRGGSGFGREFQDLSVNDWGNGQALDAAAAADFVRKQTWSNQKVGIYGYSYGGITSMAAITRVPDAFDAAVPMAGIYDFGDAYTNADRLGKIFIKTGHGGSPEDRAEIYSISNALSRVKDVKTPLLLMHGERDVRAPFRQFELAVEILKREGKTFESKSYPGEPHGFRNPRNRIDMYQRLEAWFDKHLK